MSGNNNNNNNGGGNNNKKQNAGPFSSTTTSTTTSYSDRTQAANQAVGLVLTAGGLIIGTFMYEPTCALFGWAGNLGKRLVNKLSKKTEGDAPEKVVDLKDIHDYMYNNYGNLKPGEQRGILKNLLVNLGLDEGKAKEIALEYVPIPNQK